MWSSVCAKAEDQSAIRTVNESAFGRPDEATLIDELRKESAVILSLVAEMKKAGGGAYSVQLHVD